MYAIALLYLQQIRKDGTLDKIYETVNRSTRLAAQGDLDTKQLEPTAVINPRTLPKAIRISILQCLS